MKQPTLFSIAPAKTPRRKRRLIDQYADIQALDRLAVPWIRAGAGVAEAYRRAAAGEKWVDLRAGRAHDVP